MVARIIRALEQSLKPTEEEQMLAITQEWVAIARAQNQKGDRAEVEDCLKQAVDCLHTLIQHEREQNQVPELITTWVLSVLKQIQRVV